MRYATLGLILITISGACGDDSTGDDGSVSTTGGPASTTDLGPDGDDVTTTGGATDEGSTTSAMGSTSEMATTSGMGTTDGTSAGETGVSGTFPCGDMLECSAATEYCQQTVGGAVGNPPSYVCMALPDGCAAGGTCECVATVQCGDICEMIETGVQVTCQAP